jgi:hypothetical protein
MRNTAALAVFLICITCGSAPVWAAGSDEVVRLRRLSEQEYRNSIADIFGGDIAVQGMFEPQIRINGLVATSTSVLSVTPAGFESFSKMADSIAIQVTDAAHRGRVVSCAPKSANAPDDACAAEFFSRYGRMLFRRPLTASERQARVNLAHTMTRASGDFYGGLRYGLAQMLQSPNFLFRKELAIQTGGKALSLEPYSRAARLSYLMWDTTPDDELLQAAEAGELNKAAGLDRQVDRLLASPRLEAGMRAFFADMLELDTFDTVSKDSLLFPKWSAAMASSAREETLRDAIQLALRENGDLRDLMTTRKTFLNRSLAAIYDVDFSFDGEWMPHEFAPDSGRSGIVTQVSMLSMFSHPGQSSPTKRGVALMDIFLCEPTPTPPANVDFSVINDTSGPRAVDGPCHHPDLCVLPHPQRSHRAVAGRLRYHRRAAVDGKWTAHRSFGDPPRQDLPGRSGAWPVSARQSQVPGLHGAQALCLRQGHRYRGGRRLDLQGRLSGLCRFRLSYAHSDQGAGRKSRILRYAHRHETSVHPPVG